MFIGFFIMKDIITSNGQFDITDALFESIKKNNPELLKENNMEPDNEGKTDISFYKKIWKNITGKEPDNKEWNKIFNSYISNGCDVDTFRRIIKFFHLKISFLEKNNFT